VLLSTWFIKILNGSGMLILKLLGIPSSSHRHIHSPEEIQMLIAESRDGGVLEPDEQRRLHRALELGLKTTHQLMVPRRFIAAIDVNKPAEQILQEVAASPYSHLPVYRNSLDNVIGILHTKEVVLEYLARGAIDPVENIIHPILYVPENLSAEGLLKLMRQEHRHQAIVVDEFGGTEGFVTIEDVLIEMLGEVADEFTIDVPQPEILPDGRIRLPGLMRLEEAKEWTGLAWQGEVGTLNGFIIETLGRVPDVGERLVVGGLALEIEQVEQRIIVSVLATPRGSSEEKCLG